MTICREDEPFVRWAESRKLAYHYTREPDLPQPCLKLFLGMLTVYIHRGKLHRVLAHSDGHLIDEMLCEFSQLFALCATHQAYLEQSRCRLPECG